MHSPIVYQWNSDFQGFTRNCAIKFSGIKSEMFCHVNSAATYLFLVLNCRRGEEWSGIVSGDGSVEDWTKLKTWALDMAANGLKEGDLCEWDPTIAASMDMLDLAHVDVNQISSDLNLQKFPEDLNSSKKNVVNF